MAYYQITDFKSGLDTRRMSETSPPGALARADNCHITRGGEIEKSLAWEEVYSLPAGTFGFAQAKGDFFVFGSDAEPAGMPAGITYQRLVHPDGLAMSSISSTDTFDDRQYVAAKYSNDDIVHFYDTVRTAFNPSARRRFQIKATAAGSVTSLKVDATELLAANATWADATGDAAQVLTDQVNANKAVSGWEALKDGTYVILFATTPDPNDNGKSVVITWTGADVDAHPDSDSPYTVGDVSGAATDVANLGALVKTFGQKMYTGIGSIIFFSAVNDPTQFFETTNAVGAGFINLGNQASGTRDISGIAEYADQMAIFTRQDVQIWSMTEDPSTNIKLQTLINTGTIAPHSVVSFGDIDVFYLAPSGIRSLKSRDSSNAAFASDVGTAVDTLVVAEVRDNPSAAAAARGVLEPLDGRYILAIGSEAYVFSFFPQSKISAWSKYALPGTVDAWVQTPDALYLRSGDSVYQLGGTTRSAYDASQVIVETPFIDAEDPATFKTLTAIDIACEGTWRIEVATDPQNPDVFEHIADVTGTTLVDDAFGALGRSTMFRWRLTSLNDGYARIGSFIFHYTAEAVS